MNTEKNKPEKSGKLQIVIALLVVVLLGITIAKVAGYVGRTKPLEIPADTIADNSDGAAVKVRPNLDNNIIYIDGEEQSRHSLDIETSFTVTTDAGENQVVISGGKVSVTDADCPDKLCVKQGEIDRQGETIVCLPHKLVVEIEGGAAPEFDVISK